MKMTTNSKKRTRREVLKKAGTTSAFVIPTVLTLKLADAQVAASRPLYDPQVKPNKTNTCSTEDQI